jgi:hypothetical protein
MRKKLIVVLSNTVLAIVMLVFLLISPYKYEWDVSLRQIDYDALLVLRLFWSLSAVIVLLISIYHNQKRKLMYIFYGLLLCLSLYKIITLFLIIEG